MPVDSGQPTTAGIRQFLTEFFSDEELATLCFDYFRDVYDDFASGMTKGQKIQLLIERCERRGILPNLLAAIQSARPEQYKERFPQVEIQPEYPRLERDSRQVFISHARQDTNFAHRLAKDLQRHGWRVWIALDSIRPGEKWGEAIDRGLSESGVFIAILTPAAIQSRWVRDETYAAIELEKKGHVRFVPLDVKPCDVPNLWSVYQCVSFSGGYAGGLRELLAHLGQMGQAPIEKLVALPERSQVIDEAYGTAQKRIVIPKLASTLLTALSRDPLPLLWVGGAIVVFIVITIQAILGSRGPATPTPLAAVRPTLTATNVPPSRIAQLTSTPMSPTPTMPPARTPVPATPAMTSIAMSSISSTRVSEKDGMIMVYVPAGEILMGSIASDSQAKADEKPQHRVYLDSFWIDMTEVTNAQYTRCVQAGACKVSSDAYDSRFNQDSQPVVGIDWYDAQAYCQWGGRQLPTEAQWEKAARGTDNRIYPWGNQPATCEYAVMNDGSGNGCGRGNAAWSVGSKPKGASPYGALDMAGNVMEWVADWYSDTYYVRSPSQNPEGPSSGQSRVTRGGRWLDIPPTVRAASRNTGKPEYRDDHLGFRCAVLSGELVPSTAPPAATPGIGSTRVSDKDGMVMVYVPAGEFLMGSANSNKDAMDDEKPQHTVYLDAFWIDKTEVTQAQYKKCVRAGTCEALLGCANGDTQPVVCVQWDDAQAYCQWAGRELPTEAQWEKAARGSDGRIYPWGNQAATCEYAVMNDDSGSGCGKGNAVWPTGSKPKGASPYGVLDMAGNVWEWMADWYDERYYASSPPRNPQGPSSGQYRVVRGGEYGDLTQDLRGASRSRFPPWSGYSDGGFRCACAPGSSSEC